MGKTVLSVDDSPSMRQIIKSCLVNNGYDVIEATDGEDGLIKVNSHNNIDLILVDVNMPKMDGITFVRELRKISAFKSKPVIMLTTEDQDEKKMEGKSAGANGWIVKPFNPEDFIKVINRLTS